MLDFSVKNLEGLSENLSCTGCYITVEGNLIDVITPLTKNSLDSSIRIPSSGKIHLIIKNMREGDKMIGSVSLPISLLTNTHWLPLFDSLDYDSLQSLPDKVDIPRIQISVVQASTEYSSNFIDKIKSLQLKIIDLEHTLVSERWEFQREIGSLSSSQRYREDSKALIIEQLKSQVEKQEILIQDLLSQKNDLKNSIESENQWKSDLQHKYKNFYSEFESSLQKSQERDSEYVKIISSFKEENLEIRAKLDLLSTENYEKDLLISHLNEKINHLSIENYENIMGNLKDKLKLLQNHLNISEANRNSLQEKLEKTIEKIGSLKPCSKCEELEKENFQLHSQISSIESEYKDHKQKLQEHIFPIIQDDSYTKERLSSNLSAQHSKIMNLEPGCKNIQDSYTLSESSDLSSKILQLMLENKYLKSQVLVYEDLYNEVDEALKMHSESFVKVSYGQYVYNNAKVNVFMENNTLMCRTGIPVPLHEFFAGYNQESNSTTPCDSSFKEIHKRLHEIASEPGDCSYTSEEDKKDDIKKKDPKHKTVIINKQFKPDKKIFAPLRQSSAHMERRKTGK
jgi:hypothetical protein